MFASLKKVSRQFLKTNLKKKEDGPKKVLFIVFVKMNFS